MKYLHTMVRVSDLEKSLDFYCAKLGLIEARRYDEERGRFTNVFLCAPGDESAQIELTYNWDPRIMAAGVTLATWRTRLTISMRYASD